MSELGEVDGFRKNLTITGSSSVAGLTTPHGSWTKVTRNLRLQFVEGQLVVTLQSGLYDFNRDPQREEVVIPKSVLLFLAELTDPPAQAVVEKPLPEAYRRQDLPALVRDGERLSDAYWRLWNEYKPKGGKPTYEARAEANRHGWDQHVDANWSVHDIETAVAVWSGNRVSFMPNPRRCSTPEELRSRREESAKDYAEQVRLQQQKAKETLRSTIERQLQAALEPVVPIGSLEVPAGPEAASPAAAAAPAMAHVIEHQSRSTEPVSVTGAKLGSPLEEDTVGHAIQARLMGTISNESYCKLTGTPVLPMRRYIRPEVPNGLRAVDMGAALDAAVEAANDHAPPQRVSDPPVQICQDTGPDSGLLDRLRERAKLLETTLWGLIIIIGAVGAAAFVTGWLMHAGRMGSL